MRHVPLIIVVNRESRSIKRSFTAFGKVAITLRRAFRRKGLFIDEDSPIDCITAAAWEPEDRSIGARSAMAACHDQTKGIWCVR